MANSYFRFKQFTIHQDRCAMKVTTDGCLFGAWVAEEIKIKNLKGANCLDIGAGTGLLSMMVAQKNPSLIINAVEIDAQAAAQAQDNTDASPWKENITILPGDAKEMTNAFQRKYDLIISNPPFYENELASPDKDRNTAHHAGGLLLDELLAIIPELLKPDGRFYLLLPFKRYTELLPLFQKHKLELVHCTFVKQSVRHANFRVMVQGIKQGNTAFIYTEDEIVIATETGSYTASFTDLLKDYYLAL